MDSLMLSIFWKIQIGFAIVKLEIEGKFEKLETA